MSSMFRRIRRQQEKERYQRFGQAWSDERRFQRYLVEHQGAREMTDDEGRTFVLGEKPGERMERLGRKPTFAMWTRAEENRRMAEAALPKPGVAVVEDLSWDDGGEKG